MWTATVLLCYSLMQLRLGCQHSREETLLGANCGNCAHNEAIVEGGRGGDYASRAATLREAQTVLSPPNKQSESLSLGTDAFFIFIPPVANKLKTRSHCTGCLTDPVLPSVNFTLGKSSGLFKAFRTIGQNRTSVTSLAKFRKLTQTLVSSFPE